MKQNFSNHGLHRLLTKLSMTLAISAHPLCGVYADEVSTSETQQGPADPNTLHTAAAVIVDTKLKDNRFNSAVRVDLGLMSMAELANHQQSISLLGVKPEPKTQSIKAMFVVPADLTEQEVQQMSDKALDALKVKNPEVTYEFNVLRINIQGFQEEILESNKEIQVIAQDNELKASSASERLNVRKLAESLRRANQELLLQFQKWSSAYRANMNNWVNHPKSKSVMFAGAIGAGTSTLPIGAMVLSAGSGDINSLLFLQCLQVLAYDQLNSAGSGKLLEFEIEHKIPIFKDNRFVRAYNGSVFIKTLTVNYALNLLNVVWWNQLSHWQAPFEVPHPSYADIMGGSVGVLLQATATSMSDIGVATLRKKGYLGMKSEVMVLAALNLLNQLTNFSLARQAYGMYWIALGAEVGIKASIVGASKLLPAKSNRMVLIHSRLVGGGQEKLVRIAADVEEAVGKDALSAEQLEALTKDLVPADTHVYEKFKQRLASYRESTEKFLDVQTQRLKNTYFESCRLVKTQLSRWSSSKSTKLPPPSEGGE